LNNMKYYTDNLAYDYNMFLPKEKRQEAPARRRMPDNIVKMPGISGKAGAVRQKRETRKNRTFAIFTTFLVVAMVCSTIFMRVQVTEVESQLTAANKELSDLTNEQTRLEMELERKISFSNVEAAAKALGMQKKDKNQVNYIHTGAESWAEVVDGTTVAEKE
jgi:cell division protein FtsL